MSPILRLRLLAGVGFAMAGLALASLSLGCGEGRVNDPPHASATAKAATTSSPAVPPSARPTSPIHSVDRTQRKHFAWLRGEPEPLPPSIRRVLRKSTYGMNWKLAQKVPIPLQGSFWLIPGRHILCFLHAETIHEASSTCAPTKAALRHGVTIASLREARAGTQAKRLIVGVVPDGTAEAVIHTGGTASSRAIAHHLFVLRDSVKLPPNVISLRRRVRQR
jgi:hypothetical protein